MATTQRSLRVRTRAGGEPVVGQQAAAGVASEIDHHDLSEDDDKRPVSKARGRAGNKASATTTSTSFSTWRPGRAAVWVAYLVSWGVYAYVRATRSLDIGAYSWCVFFLCLR